MKGILSFFLLILSLPLLAQIPLAIKYQAVVRDNGGNILAGVEIMVQLTIRSEAPDGMAVYTEIHNTTTNAHGVISLAIGEGTPIAGAFSGISWGKSNHFLEMAIDFDDSGNYQIIGTSQFLSVPYAIEARRATSLLLTDANGKEYEIGVDTQGNIFAVSSFPCGEPFTDQRDGNIYQTIQFGDQCWMAQNLAYLPSVSHPSTNSENEPVYYVYGYNGNDVSVAKSSVNYQDFGVLYNWYAAKNTACPEGWHLPSPDDWTGFTEYVGNQPEFRCDDNPFYTARSLASNSFWESSNNQCHPGFDLLQNNATGFSAQPGGYRENGYFNAQNNGGLWWLSYRIQNQGINSAIFSYISFANQANNYIGLGFSVRCIKTKIFNKCGDAFVDKRNNKTYNTVLIGNQCWMAENLDIGDFIDQTQVQSNNGIIEKSCYNDIYQRCSQYGGLYLWDEMMNYSTAEGTKGICPDGWHIPTLSEWQTLVNHLGGEAVAGGKLKSTRTFPEPHPRWDSGNLASNSSGFGALPGGIMYSPGNGFAVLGVAGSWWSSSQNTADPSEAVGFGLYYSNTQSNTGAALKDSGSSVRCLKD